MTTAAVDAAGLTAFAKDMRKLSPLLGKALTKELREIGDHVRDEVRLGSGAPRARIAAEDSAGKPGRKRLSIKTSATQKGVAIYSREPDAGVWNWGGEISPRGAPISIPRTGFLSLPAARAADRAAEEMGDITDRLADRYAGFTGP